MSKKLDKNITLGVLVYGVKAMVLSWWVSLLY